MGVARADVAPHPPAPPRSLRERWIGWRNRLLADPGFQRWAAGFPLTKPVAQARAQALFDVVAGFVYSQIAYACVRLRVLDAVRDGPLARDDLARRTGLPADGAARLIDGAIALQLLEPLGDRVALGAQGAALLGNAGVAEMIAHHDLLYADLVDPIAMLRAPGTGALARYWGYAGADAPDGLSGDAVGPYSALMAASQPMVAAQVLDVAPLQDRRVLLDVGGGEGVFVQAAAARWPHLSFILFDLPAVIERARARLTAAGLGDRVQFVGGDFYKDPLPVGADIVSFVRVLHDHDDGAVRALLSAARRAVAGQSAAHDARVMVAEPMAGRSPVGDAYFGFYLAAMGQGRPRRPEILAAMLREAGFRRPKTFATRTPMIAEVLVASA